MSARTKWVVISMGAGLLALSTAAAFAAYLKPGMLIEFANLLLCY
jgi:hypothetical protein